MRKKISIAGLILAWVCANGAIWDVMQVFAWGKMFAGYAGYMSVGDAISATLDPAKRCQLCATIAEAKDGGPHQAPLPANQAFEKLVLAPHASAKIVFSHSPVEWPTALASAAPSRTEPVPLPPPRA